MATLETAPAKYSSIGGFYPNPVKAVLGSTLDFEILGITDKAGNFITEQRQRIINSFAAFKIQSILGSLVSQTLPDFSGGNIYKDTSGAFKYGLRIFNTSPELFQNISFITGAGWTQTGTGTAWAFSVGAAIFNYPEPTSPPLTSQFLGQNISVSVGDILTIRIDTFVDPPSIGNYTKTGGIYLDGVLIQDITPELLDNTANSFTFTYTVTAAGTFPLAVQCFQSNDISGAGTSASIFITEFSCIASTAPLFFGFALDSRTDQTENNLEEYVHTLAVNPSTENIQSIESYFIGCPFYFSYLLHAAPPEALEDLDTRVKVEFKNVSGTTFITRFSDDETAELDELFYFRVDINKIFSDIPESPIKAAVRTFTVTVQVKNSSDTLYTEVSKEYSYKIKTPSSCKGKTVVYINNLGALESYYFEGFPQTRSSIIDNQSFTRNLSRLEQTTEKARQSSVILYSSNINTLDRLALESVFSSSAVFLYEDGKLIPVQVKNNTTAIIDSLKEVHELTLDLKLEFTNK